MTQDPFDGAGAAQAFGDELSRLKDGLATTSRDVGALERGLSGGLRRAIDGLVVDGGRLSDALSTVGRSMASAAFTSALKPVNERLSGLLAAPWAGSWRTPRATPSRRGA